MDSETTGRIARFIRLIYRMSLFLGLLSGLWLGLLVYFASLGDVFQIQLTVAIVGFVGFFGLSIPLYLMIIMWEGMAKRSKEWETEVLTSRRSREG